MPPEPIVVNAALAGMGLLMTGTFGIGVKVLLKVNELVTVVSAPKSGLVDRFEALEGKVDDLTGRVDRALGSE